MTLFDVFWAGAPKKAKQWIRIFYKAAEKKAAILFLSRNIARGYFIMNIKEEKPHGHV